MLQVLVLETCLTFLYTHFLKVLDTFMLPDSVTDWAEDSVTVKEMKHQRWRCIGVTMMFSVLQSVFNLVLLIPFLFTGTHSLFLRVIFVITILFSQEYHGQT